jgi:L-rhamnose mutarotase
METQKRYCLTLDLKDDPALIEAYERYHQAVWPEIVKSIYDSGITNMEIYRYGNRLCMIMETIDAFSFERKALTDGQNKKVQEWEKLMENYQQRLPGTAGEKWKPMDRIFKLPDFDDQ